MDHEQVRLVESPTIAVVGMATLDYLYLFNKYPVEDTVNPVQGHAVAAGGPAGRSAIVAARLGGRVHLAAMCGSDTHAEILRREFTSEPLSVTLYERPQPSQHSFVIASTGTGSRTTMWTAQPPADERILNDLDAIFRNSAIALLDCTDPTLSRPAVESCRKLGVPVVIDTGSYRKTSEEFLPGVDYIIAPEKFFKVRHPESDLDEGMRRAFDDFRPKILAATSGERGGVYLDHSGLHSYDSFEVAAVDSCGAGDTFHGAFAWAIASGAPISLSFDIASWTAAQKCTALGNGSLPDAKAITSFIAARLKSYFLGR